MYYGIKYRVVLPPGYLRFPKVEEKFTKAMRCRISQKPCVNAQFLFLAVAVNHGEITANAEVKGESKVKTILKKSARK
jgi:hypothetical protein